MGSRELSCWMKRAIIMKEFDDEMIDIKEDKRWARNAFLIVGAIVIAIVAICGLLFGKVVEATLFEEIAKWALMAVILAICVDVIFWVPITMLRDARRKYFPKYGRKWFKHAWKEHFGKK